MIRHANIMANQAMMTEGFGVSREHVGVGWLPFFHDMGLIGNVLNPMYSGYPFVLMSPLAFLQRPLRWLRAVSRYRATVSGGPNFAYDLCVRRVRPPERAALDLSSWRRAFNGAEPIRADTFDRFAETFAPSGFRRAAFYPCYGLAEATLIASGGVGEREPRLRPPLDGEARGRATLVGCGGALGGERIVVVDPAPASRAATVTRARSGSPGTTSPPATGGGPRRASAPSVRSWPAARGRSSAPATSA